MKFSIYTQSFYADGIDFGSSLPVDATQITSMQAEMLYKSINEGCYIYMSDEGLIPSSVKPDQYHSWDAVNNIWITTEEAVEQKKTDDNTLAKQQKIKLRQLADSEIEWRLDAFDTGIATEEETRALAAWKKYRVLLMRVDTTAPVWPTVPVKQAS